ncbi:hypothetical protein PENANT_c003G09537 [Penicillium antarcticum]|uniref:Uncharacterized protein n=1 Tax=Penicillium antarcticum TaxID=416450 RepID=A0A1V6QHZ4_9EURO|nr:hypothetical protein PENANT_c003G09537 [Penicillium antarcticum]
MDPLYELSWSSPSAFYSR